MAYFSALGGTGGTSATITVTYSEDFYGLTITATNGTTTLTKTATSSGTLTFDVSEGGTWIVSGTVEGATYSEQVDVFFEYTVPPLVALPDGSTALPVNDIQMWLKCAAIRDKTTYTTLADVLADTDTFIALCADSNACDYMARSTTWASTVCADATAMLIVGKYNYCGNALLDDNTWETAIRNSPYSDYVNPDPSAGYIPLVPKMTSNTTPSGVASASSELVSGGTTYSAYRAFDGNDSTDWAASTSDSDNNCYVQYKSASAVKVNAVRVLTSNWPSGTRIAGFKVQGSNTGNTNDWTDIHTVTGRTDGDTFYSFDNDTAYEYHRVLITNTVGNPYAATALAIRALQFYRKPTVGEVLIHSAVEDNIFYMDDGSPVALCGIPVGDTIDVDMEAFKGQTLTLVSTVAKDPTNLSNDFSMNVRITPNITEIYLMPLKSLYWWGYMSDNCEELSTANGWSGIFIAPVTSNTNYIFCPQTTVNGASCGIGSKTTVSGDIKAIYQGITARSGRYGYLSCDNSKVISTYNAYVATTTLQVVSASGQTNKYVSMSAYGQTNDSNGKMSGNIYALWLE